MFKIKRLTRCLTSMASLLLTERRAVTFLVSGLINSGWLGPLLSLALELYTP